MSTTFEERLDRAILSPLHASLVRIQSDLAEMDAAAIDVLTLEDATRARLRERYKEQLDGRCNDDDAGRALLELGSDGATAPAPFARSMAMSGVRGVLVELVKSLEQLESGEDEKVAAWIKKTLSGQKGRVNYGRLTIDRAAPLPDDVMRCLRLARQALDADDATLQRLGAVEPSAEQGHVAFVKDLAEAIASSDRRRQLLRDLWDAATAEDIDTVLAHPDIVGGPHQKPIGFYGGLLKEVLALTPEERLLVAAELKQ